MVANGFSGLQTTANDTIGVGMAKKNNPTGRTYISAGISIDPQTLELAKVRMSKLRMGWSEYVRRCLEIDIESDSDMVIKSKPTTTPSGNTR
jgi:hypothetical protein